MRLRTIRRLSAAALLLVALYFVVLALHLFKQDEPWLEDGILVIGAALAIIAWVAKVRVRTKELKAAKSTRDSLLKHIWELRHRREW